MLICPGVTVESIILLQLASVAVAAKTSAHESIAQPGKQNAGIALKLAISLKLAVHLRLELVQ